MAPELHDGKAYTAAVDIWSLGAIAFCARSGSPPFTSLAAMFHYVIGNAQFPMAPLTSSSTNCSDFIRAVMAPSAANRLTIEEAKKHVWLRWYRNTAVSAGRRYISQSAHVLHSI
jgi:serine/threonine protein kinase